MNLSEVFERSERQPGLLRTSVPEQWMQGRTAYGGLSAALAHEAARSVAPDLPPLRSMQANLIAPLSGHVSVQAEVLRRGRSVAFVQADVISEIGLGFRAVFVFSAARESEIKHLDATIPAAPKVREAGPVIGLPAAVPFLSNFEMREASTGDGAPEFTRWVRLTHRQGLTMTTEMLACADALPPAAMALADRPRAISSVNWTMNLFEAEAQDHDGWWLLRARADQVGDGGSSQTMWMWNANLKLVAMGMQNVALFWENTFL